MSYLNRECGPQAPMNTDAERRRRRSEERHVALRYQLEHSRDHGRLEALVLADDGGIVVSGAGDTAICEELAAFGPLMARSPANLPLPDLLRGGEVAVRPLRLHGQELFLVALGGNVARDALLHHSTQGVHRILAAN